MLTYNDVINHRKARSRAQISIHNANAHIKAHEAGHKYRIRILFCYYTISLWHVMFRFFSALGSYSTCALNVGGNFWRMLLSSSYLRPQQSTLTIRRVQCSSEESRLAKYEYSLAGLSALLWYVSDLQCHVCADYQRKEKTQSRTPPSEFLSPTHNRVRIIARSAPPNLAPYGFPFAPTWRSWLSGSAYANIHAYLFYSMHGQAISLENFSFFSGSRRQREEKVNHILSPETSSWSRLPYIWK